MKFHMNASEIFVPDGTPVEEAIKRTTHMGISAHQDDLEIMAYKGVLECFGQSDKWFLGVVVTDGAGSPRDDIYANYTDDEMRKVRRVEQKKAAFVGEYTAQALLDFPSSAVKDPANTDVVDDLAGLFAAAKPSYVYTHNLADKHDTHIGAATKVIKAIRTLPKEDRPKAIYGCEVWRSLDWLADADKTVLDVAAHENLATALLGVFDSQIAGGKRYDLATMGRRRANATYHASHGIDDSTSIAFAMDMTPLIKDETLDIKEFVNGYIRNFAKDVSDRLTRVLG
ncbi:MAG: PIG-L family deacetylase [Armatimonadota bacterium]